VCGGWPGSRARPYHDATRSAAVQLHRALGRALNKYLLARVPDSGGGDRLHHGPVAAGGPRVHWRSGWYHSCRSICRRFGTRLSAAVWCMLDHEAINLVIVVIRLQAVPLTAWTALCKKSSPETKKPAAALATDRPDHTPRHDSGTVTVLTLRGEREGLMLPYRTQTS
jgi:hypothetical protein